MGSARSRAAVTSPTVPWSSSCRQSSSACPKATSGRRPKWPSQVLLPVFLTRSSSGFGNVDKTPTPNLRMADFAKLIVAAEPRLPWRQGAFLEAYAVNRVNLNATLIESDEVAKRLLAFAEKNGSWSGLMSVLYSELGQDMSPEQRRAVEWPGNVRWFSDRVTRAAPALRAMGITVTSRHGKQGTSVTIGKIASPASPDPEMAESAVPTVTRRVTLPPEVNAIASPPRAVASPPKSQKSANGDAGDASDAIFQMSELAADDRAYLDELGGGP